MHSDLRYVGILPPLDTPHHLRATEWCNYREGVVKEDESSTGSLINVGLNKVTMGMATIALIFTQDGMFCRTDLSCS